MRRSGTNLGICYNNYFDAFMIRLSPAELLYYDPECINRIFRYFTLYFRDLLVAFFILGFWLLDVMIVVKVSVVLILGCISAVAGQFIYLNTGVFKFISGIGLPIDIGITGGSLSWFTNCQVFYKLPDNITYFEPYKVLQKRSAKSTFNRPNLYQAFVKYFERLGFSGNECIHRLICEVASREINQEENGLLGEIVDILFSPGSDSESLDEYTAAQRQGLYNGSSCEVVYTDCFANENLVFLS